MGLLSPRRSPTRRSTISVSKSATTRSTGEISPDFGNKAALVAYERDGKPLDNFRVVMPGDKHGARDVHDVVTIAVE
jgi:hypothetical protein